MHHIEEFNRLLNIEKNDRFERWESFRFFVDRMLTEASENLSETQKVVVLGAGSCDDFSLQNLVDRFDEVVLTDIDIGSIYQNNQYNTLLDRDKKKVQVKRIEYTGLENSGLFEYLENEVVDSTEYDEIDARLERIFLDASRYEFLKLEENRVDLVYVSAIYSQLILHQVILACSKLRMKGIQEHKINYLQEMITEKMSEIYKRFNDNIVRMVRGAVVVSSDILEDEVNSDLFQDLHKEFSQEKANQYYESYFKQYGYGMGDIGLYYMDHLLHQRKSQWVIWPFSKEKEMLVKLVLYKNEKLEGRML